MAKANLDTGARSNVARMHTHLSHKVLARKTLTATYRLIDQNPVKLGQLVAGVI